MIYMPCKLNMNHSLFISQKLFYNFITKTNLTQMADNTLTASSGHQELSVSTTGNQKLHFVHNTGITNNELCREVSCHCGQIQQKLKSIEAKIKKLELNWQNGHFQDEGSYPDMQEIEANQSSNQEITAQIEAIQQRKQINHNIFKEEKLALASLSQKIDAIMQKQREQNQIIKHIFSKKQSCFAFKASEVQSPIYKSSHKRISSTLVSPTQKNQSDMLEEMLSVKLSMNASNVSHESDKKSEKSDLSGSITSERRQQISNMTEGEKNQQYSHHIKDAKLMAKLKRKHK